MLVPQGAYRMLGDVAAYGAPAGERLPSTFNPSPASQERAKVCIRILEKHYVKPVPCSIQAAIFGGAGSIPGLAGLSGEAATEAKTCAAEVRTSLVVDEERNADQRAVGGPGSGPLTMGGAMVDRLLSGLVDDAMRERILQSPSFRPGEVGQWRKWRKHRGWEGVGPVHVIGAGKGVCALACVCAFRVAAWTHTAHAGNGQSRL